MQKIFYQKLKKTLSNEQFKIFKKSKNILAILFLYILHMPSFKKASFNSNRDIRQNIRGDGGDGGYGDLFQNNTSHRFSKTDGR